MLAPRLHDEASERAPMTTSQMGRAWAVLDEVAEAYERARGDG
jgi:hypothetical protein